MGGLQKMYKTVQDGNLCCTNGLYGISTVKKKGCATVKIPGRRRRFTV